MKTLARLFSLMAAGVVFYTATASVIGPNPVGYVNTTLAPGFNLISAPLYDPSQTVGTLTAWVQGVIPDGLTVYLLYPEGYRTAQYNAASGTFEPADVAAEPLTPGRGFFVFNPATNNVTVTFVGGVMQGNLTNALPAGFSLIASMVPQQASLDILGFPGKPGDVVYLFNASTQSFEVAIFDELDGTWVPNLRPIRTGEAFVVLKRKPALWTRRFFVVQ
jgi:hypothetical protein